MAATNTAERIAELRKRVEDLEKNAPVLAAATIQELGNRVTELENWKMPLIPTNADIDARIRLMIPAWPPAPPRQFWLAAAIVLLGIGSLVSAWQTRKAVQVIAAKQAVIVNPAPATPTAATITCPPNQICMLAPNSSTGTVIPVSTVLHSLELSLTAPCWLRVTEQTPDASVLYEGNAPKELHKEFTFDEKTAIEVRAGCPGDVVYKINGNLATPPNASKTPKVSEVVDLLI
jgi:hypothetical protein